MVVNRRHGRASSVATSNMSTSCDDPEADDLSCIHPITGTFRSGDIRAAAFRSKVFRFMFPMHVVALAALVCTGASVVFESGSAAGGALLMSLLLTSIGVLGISSRIAVHRWEDQDQAQRYGVFVWTMCVASGCIAEAIAYVPGLHIASVMCGVSSMYASPLVPALFALINASHGMEFWHTLSLTSLALCKQSFVHIMCGKSPQTCDLVLVAVCAAGHFVQLRARHAFLWQSEHLQTRLEEMRQQNEDTRRLEGRLLEEKRQLEERDEQLQAEKERLLYDVQRRGRPLDDDRSALRRGLLAGPNHPSPFAVSDTSSSSLSGGVKPPSDYSPPPSPPPSLPPGPPSSTSSGYTVRPSLAKPTALPPARAELDAQPRAVEREVAHALLSCARGETHHQGQSAEAACGSGAAGADLPCAAPILPIPRATLTHRSTSSVAAAASHELSGSVGCSASSNGVPTPEQALLVARRSMLLAQDQIHLQRVVRTLGIALGASRMEAATIKALHAVLQQLARPGMTDTEAYRSTGASRSNFTKWRRRVQHVESAGGGKAVYEYLVRTPSCLLPLSTTKTLQAPLL